jgi:Leucine-rich repeat (LRR) protein
MNQYIIQNCFLLIKNKTNKLLKFDNYFYKLLFIIYYNDYFTNSKIYKKNFELYFKLDKLINKFNLIYNNNHDLNKLFKAKQLKIRDGTLLFIPTEIIILQNLEHLVINTDRFKFIPSEVCSLYNLKILDIYSPSLKSIPKSIYKLINLESLSLTGKIKLIPIKISLLKNLIKINLSGNKIKIIPTDFGLLINLQQISLQNNKIKIIPDIKLLKNLERLELYNNRIKIIFKQKNK